MATMRESVRSSEENGPRAAKGVKAEVAQQGAEAKRRAFGDIGNIQGGVTTRSQAAKEKAGVKPQTSLRPRDLNAATAAALRSKVASSARPAGLSLSGLLQARADTTTKAQQQGGFSGPLAPPPSPLPNIDAADVGNPLAEPEYAHSIYNYYRRVEGTFHPGCDIMGQQREINEKMRGILVDWLVEVHLKFKLMPETLYLTCNIIDRYLKLTTVSRKRLQLVGVTAMLIASKYEEIWAPEVNDFVYISDKAYTREDILGMEKTMLATLRYDLTVPTTYLFTARFRKAAGVQDDLRVAQMCEYLSELCLVDLQAARHPLSLLSAAVLHVALTALGRADTYPRALRRHARYELDEVLPAARHVVALMQRAPESSLRAVFRKHLSSKFGEVAKVGVPVLPEPTGA